VTNPFRPSRAALPHSLPCPSETGRDREPGRRPPLVRVLAGLGLALGLAWAAPACAQPDFTLTETVPSSGDGTFTLVNDSAGYSVSELVVSGLGTYADTTRAGWSAAAMFFDDPLNCQAGTGYAIGAGFCYALTNTAAGSAIGPGAQETFTFDPSFTDPTLAQTFFVEFTDAAGDAMGCMGTTSSGCSAAVPVPEPQTWSLMALALLALAIGLRRRVGGSVMHLGALAGALLGWCLPSQAGVTAIVIDSTTAVSGAPIPYASYKGRVFGELDPADAHNAIIQDIALAPKNANGKVPYVSTFQLTAPTDSASASGLMVYEVSNRGSNPIPAGASIVSGAIYLVSGWQGDIEANCATAYPCAPLNVPYTGSKQQIVVPVAMNADGSAITGNVYGHVASATGTTAQMIIYDTPVPYKPLSMTDPTLSTLTAVASQTTGGVDGAKTPLTLGVDWAWADCRTVAFPGTPDPTRVCLKNGFNSSMLYEMVYTAVNPLVLGVGYAAARDAISFFHHDAADSNGTANPVAGLTTKVVSIGSSQSASFIRGSIFYGFNQDESNQQVVDGAWGQIDGRMLFMNARFALPDVITNLYMMGDEAPVWWADYPNLARGLPANGILHRCNETGTCPEIMETFGSLEMYAEKMSPDLVGMTAQADIPLPANVHRYYFPGTTHGGGGGGFTYNATPAPSGACVYPANANPESDQNAALQDDFFALVMSGAPMPPSAYPRFSQGQLAAATQSDVGFPNIPGYPYQGSHLWPVIKYDFGPQVDYSNQSGIMTIQPPIVDAVLPTLVPRVNVDGNEVVGVPSVNIQAPLATYSGWNTYAAGSFKGQQCALSGSSWPFAATKALRVAAGDPRASIGERYGTHAGFVCQVTAAANKAVAQRFLRASSVATLVAQAQSSNVLTTGYTPTAADTALGNALCAMAARTAP
jgi:hypothetical protein